jgi:pyocin large subunit-like protein
VRRSVSWIVYAWLILAVAVTLACRTSAAAPAAETPRVDRERMAAAAWAPGQLAEHFSKHGQEGPYCSAAQYDAAARETIRSGTTFSYLDRESNAERVGFYDKANNRFTSVTRDGARITTHFRPTRGEAYVRGLERSTYR